MMNSKTGLIVLIISAFAGGCYYDVEEELYPSSGNCNTADVSFSATVMPILQRYGCTGCHSGSAPSGNVLLTTQANVRVVALNGKLFGTINHSPGFSPMPQGGNKMNACDINLVKAWVDAGAPNN